MDLSGFKKLAIDSFIEDVKENQLKDAKKYVKSEEAQKYIEKAWRSYNDILKNKERYEKECGHLKPEQVIKNYADQAAWCMFMSF